MSWKNVILNQRDTIAIVTINRPRVLNALNSETITELHEIVTRLDGDRSIRAVIITGSVKVFVAGADISEMEKFTPAEAMGFSRLGHKAMDAIQNMEKPVIAAVNGFALGGGLELALACDIIIAGENAVLGLPEVNLGLIQGFGGTQRLPRLVGRARAKELIFTGGTVNARRAYEMGLVNRVVPRGEALAEAETMVKSIVEKGPRAVALAKRVIDTGCEKSLQEGCSLEVEAFGECFATADRVEGIEAFLEKRKPDFTGT